MEGCGEGGVEEGRVEGILEGIRAVLLEGVSRECNGAGGV